MALDREDAAGAASGGRSELSQKDRNLVKALASVGLLGVVSGGVGLRVAGGDVLRLAGAVVLARSALLCGAAVRTALRPALELSALGSWSVVTGCTGGLGQEFARGLAARGQNLVLVSRSQAKLEAVGRALEREFGVRWLALTFDFSECSAEREAAFYERELPRALRSAPVGGDVALLVNNVGVGDEAPFMVHELKGRDVAEMIKVNCAATVNMSRAVLPLLKERGRGAVINVSSGSSAQPTPYLATYSATKAFILQFSRSCAREYREFGLTVSCIRPYYISGTGLYPNATPAINAPAAKTIVDGALADLGRYEVSYAYWAHTLMGWIFSSLFEDPLLAGLVDKLARSQGMNGSMLAIQKAARARAKL
jgi:17beta-estradiol 17-dehydrogenase / very-long-chain 3-oxoacyl-CoA reductase